CGEFESIWRFFSDDLTESREYDFKSSMLKNYCPKPGNCNNDIDKINAGCLWLFNKFYGNNSNFSIYANGNMNIVVYFMTWLSYKLNQKPQSGVNKFNDFYSKHMKNVKEYTNNINDVTGYTSYIDLINKKENLMDIDIELMSKFYDLFKNLCKMYNDFSKKSNNSKKYIEYANKFADEYKKLFNDNDNNIKGSSYDQILTTLSNDYNYFKNYCNKINDDCSDIPPLPEIKTTQDYVQDSGQTPVQNSEATSPSSPITNKLIPVLSIIVAIPIFLGIFYKYSLFGFRKRSQKQYLREKIKK
ncbi:putative yir2 protein, partial [Plasmodium yoelii yoelii]